MSFEDCREPMLFDQDEWATSDEYTANALEWGAMALLPWVIPKSGFNVYGDE